MAYKRFFVSDLGEYYMDCLKIECAIKGRTKANEAASLLCAKLGEREQKREKIVQYLANKRNISFDEMWQQLRDGEYQPSQEELQELDDNEE